MKAASSTSCMRFAILLLASLGNVQAQTQAQPSVTYDSIEDEWIYLWQTNRNRTFFPQSSLDLGSWDYFGALHFGPGSHVGRVQNNSSKGFFRLQYSDLPVATESEAETADFDLDGLTNIFELQESHTDPLGRDTDGDTLPDGWEVAHSTSPLDDGAVNPQNGPEGIFQALSSGNDPGPSPLITNAGAFSGGVQDHPNATLKDLDGDGLANEIDAGMYSRAINWITHHSAPHFVYRSISGYNSVSHGLIRGCNNIGDVIAERAIYSNGTWHLLGQLLTGEENYLPLSVQVDGRTHRAYVVAQPTATSVSDTGVVVGTGTVRFEPIEEEVTPNNWVTHQPPATTFAFVWDAWNLTPRILAHSPNSVLQGSYWDEYAQTSGDNVVIVRRRALPTSATNTNYQFQRISPIPGQSGTTSPYGVYVIFAIGERGLQAFNLAGGSNAFCWLPESSTPHSLLAESTFKTFNPRSFFFSAEPIYAGITPGAVGSHCLNFWDKTMIRYEDRWQEAIEIGDAALVTRKGVAVRSKLPTAVNLWQGGQTISLINAVANKDFTGSYVYPFDSTVDGRILINHFSQTEANSYGFLVPIDIDEVIADQIPGSFDNKLPSPYFKGYANNPMLMATTSLQQADLRVRVSHADPQIYVGARKRGTTAILGSAQAASEIIDFTFSVPEFSNFEYEIVAGYDTNASSVLDAGEVRVVFEKTPRADKDGNAATASLHLIDKIAIADSSQVNLERGLLLAAANVPGTDFAGDLLEAFITGSTTVSDASLSPPVTIAWNEPGLSHPVGARWDLNGEDLTYRFTFVDGSLASDHVEDSNAMAQIVGEAITLNKTALLNAHPGGDDYVTSSFINFTNEPDFNQTDPSDLPEEFSELGLAFGKVTITGTVRVSYKKTGSFLIVGGVEVIGSFDDLYDFAWGAGSIARQASFIQAGHATLAPPITPDSGKVFFTRVQFNTGFANTWNGTY